MPRYIPCPKCRTIGRDSHGDNLVVFNDGGKHCFSCGYHEYSPDKTTLSRWNQDVVNSTIQNVHKDRIPFDFTREVPSHAWQWLLQYDIPYSYWKPHCGYSPNEERLVFTVGNPIQFSIGRYVGKEANKRKWYAWGDPHKYVERINAESSEPVVILVEDLISAHKIGLAGYEAIPLFGTSLRKDVIYYLQMQPKLPILWLDKDQEATIRSKAAQLSGLIQHAVDVRVSDLDPKKYSLDKLKEIIRHGI